MRRTLSVLLAICLVLLLSAETLEAANSLEDSGFAYQVTTSVDVNEKIETFHMYALRTDEGDTNYIRLRDLAQKLNGTSAQFNVTWDGQAQAMNIVTGVPYESSDTVDSVPFVGEQPYEKTVQPLYVDGELADGLSAFTLKDENGGGYNYFQLRELSELLGFETGYSTQRKIIWIRSGGIVAQPTNAQELRNALEDDTVSQIIIPESIKVLRVNGDLNLTRPVLVSNKLYVDGSLTVTSTLEVSGNVTVLGNVTNRGEIDVSGVWDAVLDRQMDNSGTFTVKNGGQADFTLAEESAVGVFYNTGAISVIGGSSLETLNLNVENEGAVSISDGGSVSILDDVQEDESESQRQECLLHNTGTSVVTITNGGTLLCKVSGGCMDDGIVTLGSSERFHDGQDMDQGEGQDVGQDVSQSESQNLDQDADQGDSQDVDQDENQDESQDIDQDADQGENQDVDQDADQEELPKVWGRCVYRVDSPEQQRGTILIYGDGELCIPWDSDVTGEITIDCADPACAGEEPVWENHVTYTGEQPDGT